jgi:FkbM family methyltransferase
VTEHSTPSRRKQDNEMKTLVLDKPSKWPDPDEFRGNGCRFELTEIVLPELRFPLYARNGTSDLFNINQIFARREYGSLPITPTTVLDLGAYCGYAAVFLADRYPDSIVVSLEPEQDNFRMLLLNSRPYPNIYCVNAGVWSEGGFLKLQKQVGGDWGNIFTRIEEGDSIVEAYPALDIRQIVDAFGFESIDFLKLDVEGSELELFTDYSAQHWIHLVKVVSCETHDRFVPGCSDAYQKLFSPEFDFVRKGCHEYFIRKGIGASLRRNMTRVESVESIKVFNPPSVGPY